jgi:ankyrin repeat protein
VMLLVSGIPLVLALVLWFFGAPRLAIAAGVLPFAAALVWKVLGWQGERAYVNKQAGADVFEGQAKQVARAISEGDTATLRELKAKGADFNARDSRGESLLIFALFYWPAQVPLLLELGADPNLDAGPGTGPVYFASVNGRSDAVAALLKAGGKPDVTDAEGTPVIFHTLKGNDTRAFGYLIEAGADISGRDDRGYTLLMATAWHRKWREATMLLEGGIDPKAVGKYGDTLESILREMHLEPEERTDPDYLAFRQALERSPL